MRDSVKVTVDALTGDMRFYANGDDPIRDAWAKLFPTVVTPGDQMPASVAKHLRAPEKFFSAQAAIYRSFHMTDVNVFYNKEDQWDIAKDSSGKKIKPAYLMLGQPGAKSKGMYLLQPYSLPNKDNLVALDSRGVRSRHVRPAHRLPASQGARDHGRRSGERAHQPGSEGQPAAHPVDPTGQHPLVRHDDRSARAEHGRLRAAHLPASPAEPDQPARRSGRRQRRCHRDGPHPRRRALEGMGRRARPRARRRPPRRPQRRSTRSSTQLEAAKASGDWTTYGARLDELRTRLNGDSGTAMPQTN